MKIHRFTLTVKTLSGIKDTQREVLVSMACRKPCNFEFIKCVPIRRRAAK